MRLSQGSSFHLQVEGYLSGAPGWGKNGHETFGWYGWWRLQMKFQACLCSQNNYMIKMKAINQICGPLMINNCLRCIILESYYHLLAVKMYDTSGNFFFFLSFIFPWPAGKEKRWTHKADALLPIPGPGHALAFSPLKPLLIGRWGGVTAVNGMFLHSEV